MRLLDTRQARRRLLAVLNFFVSVQRRLVLDEHGLAFPAVAPDAVSQPAGMVWAYDQSVRRWARVSAPEASGTVAASLAILFDIGGLIDNEYIQRKILSMTTLIINVFCEYLVSQSYRIRHSAFSALRLVFTYGLSRRLFTN